MDLLYFSTCNKSLLGVLVHAYAVSPYPFICWKFDGDAQRKRGGLEPLPTIINRTGHYRSGGALSERMGQRLSHGKPDEVAVSAWFAIVIEPNRQAKIIKQIMVIENYSSIKKAMVPGLDAARNA